MHPASAQLWERYGLLGQVRRAHADPLLTDEGELTETRDYNTYARAFDTGAARKWEQLREVVRPGRIVDVGCGVGSLLHEIAADPAFAESDLYGIEAARPLYDECVHRRGQGAFENPNTFFFQRTIGQGAAVPARQRRHDADRRALPRALLLPRRGHAARLHGRHPRAHRARRRVGRPRRLRAGRRRARDLDGAARRPRELGALRRRLDPGADRLRAARGALRRDEAALGDGVAVQEGLHGQLGIRDARGVLLLELRRCARPPCARRAWRSRRARTASPTRGWSSTASRRSPRCGPAGEREAALPWPDTHVRLVARRPAA